MTPTTKAAFRAVAAAFDLIDEDLIAPSRARRIARARWAVMVLLRDEGLSYIGVGAQLGLDHTTVMHGVEMAAKMPVDWHARLEDARLIFKSTDSAPIGRQVYAKPIGPPTRPAWWDQEHYAPFPRKRLKPAKKRAAPPRDALWADLLAGAQFVSVPVAPEAPYREQHGADAREIAP